MKNETDRQINRHSLPTRMCFNFFYSPHKNFEMPTHIAHIAKDTRANAPTKALSKSAILPTLLVSLTILINLYVSNNLGQRY